MGLIDDLKAYVAKYKATIKLAMESKAKLNDGVTEITWDTDVLGVGSMVMTYDTTGATLPLPIGDYTLEDGTTFSVVDEMGTADKVVLVEVDPNAEKPAEEKPQDMESVNKTASEAGAAAAKTVIESVIKESRFVNEEFVSSEIKKANEEKETFAKAQNEKIASLETEISEQKKMITEMFSMIEKIGSESSQTPTEGGKDKFTKRKSIKELSAEFKAALK